MGELNEIDASALGLARVHKMILRVIAGALGCPDREEMEPRDSPSQALYTLADEVVAYARARLLRADELRPLSPMERLYCSFTRMHLYDLAYRAERAGCGLVDDVLVAVHRLAFEVVGDAPC